MPKMKILNAPEQKSFEMPPVFNSVERKRYFTLPLALQESVSELRVLTTFARKSTTTLQALIDKACGSSKLIFYQKSFP